MTQKEKNYSSVTDIHKWNENVQNLLEEKYAKVKEENGIQWFAVGVGAFRAVPFEEPFCGFIVEYAEGRTEKDFIFADDVDQYPISDYSSPEELTAQIVLDIEE